MLHPHDRQQRPTMAGSSRGWSKTDTPRVLLVMGVRRVRLVGIAPPVEIYLPAFVNSALSNVLTSTLVDQYRHSIAAQPRNSRRIVSTKYRVESLNPIRLRLLLMTSQDNWF